MIHYSVLTRSGIPLHDLLTSRALMRQVLAAHAVRHGRRFEVVA